MRAGVRLPNVAGLIRGLVVIGVLMVLGTALPARAEVTNLTLGDRRFKVEVARSYGELVTGLAGRKSLAPNAGMLFILPRKARYCFQTFDMNFPIEIVFVNDARRVTQAVYGAPGGTYCSSMSTTKFVLEINPAEVQPGVAMETNK